MAEPLILDRYRLLERIATGGSAEVWRARDEQLGREVAVKRLHPHLVPDDASRKRLAAEARAAAGLSHPVIVGIYDVDATGETPALVMELVDGESLAARIARTGALPAPEAAAVAADVAEALFHAHQLGVIHRDVKPGNVLLSHDGRTRLVDFGIAHSLATSAERLTLTGTVIGTLAAMAPEQLSGGPITPRTDLYGLGVVLHEALTGRPPYPATSPVALADAQRAGPPALDGVDPALAAAVAGCLAFEPADRPLHAGALAEALRAWLAGDPAPATALGPSLAAVDPDAVTRTVVVPPVPDPAAAEPAGGSPSPRVAWRGRRRTALVLAGLAVLVLLVAAALVNGRPGGPTGGDSGTSSMVTPSPTAAPTPVPAWAAEAIARVEEACRQARADEFAAETTALDKKATEDAAKEAVDACEDEGDGGGNGNGRGGGNGNGRGGDD
jgi:eukaryotic-like serine/threonine-protein kinase